MGNNKCFTWLGDMVARQVEELNGELTIGIKEYIGGTSLENCQGVRLAAYINGVEKPAKLFTWSLDGSFDNLNVEGINNNIVTFSSSSDEKSFKVKCNFGDNNTSAFFDSAIEFCEYLQNESGAPYIDTEHIIQLDEVVSTQFQILEYAQYRGSFSDYVSESNVVTRIIPSSQTQFIVYFCNITSSGSTTINLAWNSVVSVELSNKKAVVNGTTYTLQAPTRAGDRTMFIMRSSVASETLAPLKQWAFKITKASGDVVADFVPCRLKTNTTRKSSATQTANQGEYGMYNKVDGLFYGNAKTSGIIKGY